jgi:hypothetical protein
MKTIYAILFCISALQLFSQPIINKSWISSPGDICIVQKAGYDSFPNLNDLLSYRINKHDTTWDYTRLIPINEFDTIQYSGTGDSLIRTDHSGVLRFYWQGDTLKVNVSADVYCFGSTYQSFETHDGFSGSNLYYCFPLNDSVAYSQVNAYNNGWMWMTGTCRTETAYLGSGRLLLPGNVSYDSVILIYQRTDTSCYVYDDGIYDDEYGELLSTTEKYNYSYQWIAQGVKNPLLTINLYSSLVATWIYPMNATPHANVDWTERSASVYVLKEYRPNDQKAHWNFSIYPNPAADILTITIPDASENYSYILYDLTGRIVRAEQLKTNENIFYRGNLSQGCYILRLKNAAMNTQIDRKVIFQ